MENNSPISIQSDDSKDQCIICLSNISDSSITFPCMFSSCKCKYIMNLTCIKENNIEECPICKSEIKYSKSIDLLNISDFKPVKIKDLKIDIPQQPQPQINTNTHTNTNINIYRHEQSVDPIYKNCVRSCINAPFVVSCIVVTILVGGFIIVGVSNMYS